MSTNNKSIQILRGNNENKLSDTLKQTVLEPGQPYFDKFNKTLQVGDGVNNLNNAPYVTVKDGAINDAKVASDAAIKGSKLANASNDESNPTGITTEKIENSAVTSGKLKRTDVYVMHQLLCEDNDTNRDARYTASSLQFVDHNKKYKPGAGSKFVSSRLSLVPNETVAGGFTLKMPWVSGTLATKEQVENGEIIAQTSQNATNATYAQYASEDTTKGTIEERLTRLGFKLGYITLNSNVALWSQVSSDMILDEGRTRLRILRCGNYAMIPTQLIQNGSNGKSLAPLYFTAQVKLTGGEIIGTISNNCIPDRTQIIVGTINIDDKLAGTGTVFVEQFLIKGRDGAPEDLWNLHSTWIQVNEAPIGSIIYLNVSNRGISNRMGVYFPYVGPTPPDSGYSDYWTVPSDFSVKNLTSISLYSTPID